MKMYIQSVDNQINEEMKAEYIRAAKEFALDSMANDEGCLGVEVLEDMQRPDHIFIVSRWETRKNMENAKAFLRHKADLKPAFCGNVTTVMITV